MIKTFRVAFLYIGFALIIYSCQSKKAISTEVTESTSEPIANVKVGVNERGVIFRRFSGGVDTTQIYLPGKYYVAPIDRFFLYNIDPQFEEDLQQTFAKGEINIQMKIKYSFNPIPEKVALLHYYIGSDFHSSVVKPDIRSTINEYIGAMTVAEISRLEIEKHESRILDMARATISKKYIELKSFRINELVVKSE